MTQVYHARKGFARKFLKCIYLSLKNYINCFQSPNLLFASNLISCWLQQERTPPLATTSCHLQNIPVPRKMNSPYFQNSRVENICKRMKLLGIRTGLENRKITWISVHLFLGVWSINTRIYISYMVLISFQGSGGLIGEYILFTKGLWSLITFSIFVLHF